MGQTSFFNGSENKEQHRAVNPIVRHSAVHFYVNSCHHTAKSAQKATRSSDSGKIQGWGRQICILAQVSSCAFAFPEIASSDCSFRARKRTQPIQQRSCVGFSPNFRVQARMICLQAYMQFQAHRSAPILYIPPVAVKREIDCITLNYRCAQACWMAQIQERAARHAEINEKRLLTEEVRIRIIYA